MRRRDANEPGIIAALKAAGCAVQQLDGAGVPDLLVSRDGVLHLVEVKNPEAKGGAKPGGERTKGHGALTPAQVKWWSAWKGKPPVIVTTPQEALKAIGIVDGNALEFGTTLASRQATPSQGGAR